MKSILRYSVRTASAEDAEAMGMIHTESWKSTYKGIIHQSFLDALNLNERIQGAKNRIKNPQTDCLVLVENETNKVVGFSHVGANREKNVDADGEVYAIYLLEQYQNTGGGSLLFKESLAKAKARGFAKVMVSVLAENLNTCKFYEKMGGEFIGSDHVDIEEHRYATSTYIYSQTKLTNM